MSLTPSHVGDFDLSIEPTTIPEAVQLKAQAVPEETEDADAPKPMPEALDWAAIEDHREHIDFIFPGLTAGGLGMLAAPGSTGKSYMLLALGSSVAMGKRFLDDWPLNDPATVLAFFAEDPKPILHNRLRDLLFSQWIETDEERALLKTNFQVRSLVGYDGVVAQQNQQDKRWYRTDFLRQIEEAIVETSARLVLLDPLRQFHIMEENDSGEMTELLKMLYGVAFRTNAAILFAHHTNKQATSTGTGDGQGAARGSSAITDNVRWQGNMIVMTDEEAKTYNIPEENRKSYVRLSLSKANYTANLSDIWFVRGEGGILRPTTLVAPAKPGQELSFDTSTTPSTKKTDKTNKDKTPKPARAIVPAVNEGPVF